MWLPVVIALVGAAPDAAAGASVVVDAPAAVVDPAAIDAAGDDDAVPPLPSDDELRALAERDIAAARGLLRRAARTAPSSSTRALALRTLAAADPSLATARICARSLRLDAERLVRRAGAECLGRLGPRFAASQTPALSGALGDDDLDVVTMAGWALAGTGDAGVVEPLARLVGHPDPRVAALFRGYVERVQARFGLALAPTTPSSAPASDDGAPTAVPPGVALALPAQGLDLALASSWLGIYGGMAGWFHGTLLSTAHGGPAGGASGPLIGFVVGGAASAALTTYGFLSASTMARAETVGQLGTFGAMAGFGAGQLVGFPPVSGVSSADLSAIGTLVGTGLGVAFVEQNEPTMGALAAGILASVGAGAGAASLASSYGYPFDQTLGVLLVTGGTAGIATTTLLARHDIGLFPVAGAGLGMMVGGGAGALVAAALEPDTLRQTEASGWVVLSSLAVGAVVGGVGGAWLPADLDPLRAGTLRLQPPTLAILPAGGVRPTPTTMAMLSGTF